MTKNSTQKQEINRRRRLISKLRHEGVKTQGDIIQRLAADYDIVVSQQTVSLDLKALDQIWRNSALVNTDKWKKELINQYRYLYQQALSAWELSLEDAETTIQEAIDSGEGGNGGQRLKVSTKTEGQSGNPALLAQAQAALKALREILGVDAATKLEHSGPDGGPIPIKEIVVNREPVDDSE